MVEVLFSRSALNVSVAMLFALLFCTGSTAFAQAGDADEQPSQRGIDIDIKGSAGRTLTPMAIPDTQEPGGDTDDIAETVEQTLRRDMRLSGYFKVLPNDSYFFDPSKEGMGASSINFQNWFETSAQALIKSSVRKNGDKITLDLRLFDVEQGQQVDLDWEAGSTTEDGYVAEVHAFANAIIEHYTGEKGIFGTRLTYIQKVKGAKQVHVMQMDGTKQTRISKDGSINMLPSFGNGAIYYTSYRAGNPDLWVYKGGKSKKLSSQSGQNTGASYCGGKLAVTLSKGGENSDIYLIDPDNGKIEQRLTDHWAIDTSPTWSPDCKRIGFVSGRSGGPQIYVMNADGSDQKRLTYQGSYNTQPSWSPKGGVIAFSARDERNAFDIFTVDLDGNIERLTQDQGNNSDPTFSPDGRYIAFVSDRGGKGKRIWVMTSDGEIQNAITEGSGYQSPNWER